VPTHEASVLCDLENVERNKDTSNFDDKNSERTGVRRKKSLIRSNVDRFIEIIHSITAIILTLSFHRIHVSLLT
jgi:hypothetical protein